MQRMDWARALVAGLLPGALAYAFGGDGTTWWWALVLVPVAAALARPKPGSGALWALAMVLGAASVPAGARARNLVDAATGRERWPTYDLATTPMPLAPPQYVAVTGILRDGWVLGEYAVPEGDVPDQSRPAEAVLVPMTATLDEKVRLEGAIVVVRVRADAPRSQDRVTLFGRTEPLPREIAMTLVDLAGAGSRDDVGVLVDTLRVPAPAEAWTAVALLLGLGIASTIGFGLARRRSSGA